MSLANQRVTASAKLEELKTKGRSEKSWEIVFLREQIRQLDLQLLAEEVERLKTERYSFEGDTLEKQLGADAWILS